VALALAGSLGQKTKASQASKTGQSCSKTFVNPSVPSNTWRSLLGFANSKNSADNEFRARDPSTLNDLDGFAEQVSEVRGVLTISNTTAHMAGVLGVPCVVILDNGSITNWPDIGDQSPLYPHTRLVRRGNDPWVTTLQRGWAALKPMLQKR
jgi:hypothetical protein